MGRKPPKIAPSRWDFVTLPDNCHVETEGLLNVTQAVTYAVKRRNNSQTAQDKDDIATDH